MRPCCLALVLVLCSPSAFADRPDPIEALQSNDPRTAAWGAWDAAERGDVSARRHVRLRLDAELGARAQDGRRTSDQGLLLESILDAAIRLRVEPTRASMRRMATEYPDACAILAWALGRRHAALALRAFEAMRPGRLAWRALGNALARWRAPGFAALVLMDIEQVHTLQVFERKATGGPRPPPRGHVTYSGFFRRRADWPPRVHYELMREAWTGDVALAGTAWIHREVFTKPRTMWGGITTTGDDDPAGWRERWLDDLGAPDVFTGATSSIRYTGHQPLAREQRRIGADLEQRYWDWTRALVDAGVLTTEEAVTLTPRIRIDVRDERLDRRHPLPGVETRTPANPWVRRRKLLPY